VNATGVNALFALETNYILPIGQHISGIAQFLFEKRQMLLAAFQKGSLQIGEWC
jgi:hypothetical protein